MGVVQAIIIIRILIYIGIGFGFIWKGFGAIFEKEFFGWRLCYVGIEFGASSIRLIK